MRAAAGQRWCASRSWRTEPRLLIARGALIHHLDAMRFLCGPAAASWGPAQHRTRSPTWSARRRRHDLPRDGARERRSRSSAPWPRPAIRHGRPTGSSSIGSKASVDPRRRASCTSSGRSAAPSRYDLGRRLPGELRRHDRALRRVPSRPALRSRPGPADNLETLRLVEHAYWAAGLHRVPPVRS